VVILLTQRELGGGLVVADPLQTAGEWWYRVKFANSTRTHPECDLEGLGEPARTPDEYARRGEWGSVAAFRQALVMERFQHREANRSTIYAFRNQKVLFEPHQYKPLLKFLDSPDRRLLIADEVGLGKTIEAGLILAELRARFDVSRILVVCPSRLRDKWRRELNGKFGFDFDILGGQELRNWLANCRNPQGPRALRAIVSQQTLRQEDLREQFLAETQRLDLVIVDEAHHARNPGTLTTQLVQGLGENADAFLLLTATPVNLGNRDLFTLLQALRPHEFTDERVFYEEL
jgi:SNF2 family DNA or RNA helicase